ncbi:MAG: hypothetical protein ACLQB4_02405 [Beijerinckiaceae bacterium]
MGIGNGLELFMFYPSSAKIFAKIGFTAALLFALTSFAGAQSRQPQPPQPANCPFFFFCSQPSTPGANWRLYDRSGTLGRQGLGASPFHPEGPGNASY